MTTRTNNKSISISSPTITEPQVTHISSSDHDTPETPSMKNKEVTHLLSSDDDALNDRTAEPVVIKQKKISDILSLCPLSTTTDNCTRCRVVRSRGGKLVHCHCSAKPVFCNEGRTQPAEKHWSSSEVSNLFDFHVVFLSVYIF